MVVVVVVLEDHKGEKKMKKKTTRRGQRWCRLFFENDEDPPFPCSCEGSKNYFSVYVPTVACLSLTLTFSAVFALTEYVFSKK